MPKTNVTTGKPKVGGAVFRAPVGTALPSDATTNLNAAFVNLGYVSEDGLTNSNSMENDNIKAWGGDVVITVQTSKEDTFKLVLIEALDVNVLKAVYGSENVSGALATGITVNANALEPESASWVFEMIMRNGALKRIVIPEGLITEVGDIVYKDDDVVGYDVTITAVADASGNTHYEYLHGATGATGATGGN